VAEGWVFRDRQLEQNLDSTICAPLLFRGELEGFLHRPQFKHVIYAGLETIVNSLNIEEDPRVLSLCAELRRHSPSPKRDRIDQRLSQAIDKHNTYYYAKRLARL
jgi:endoribonuclease Dicer